MKMMLQTNDSRQFEYEVRRIRSKTSTVLKRWGLLPRFKRWRLSQDPDSGMIVLFGILNNGYLATHTSIPFSNYFDPRLLQNLANELQVQIVSCNSEGMRYAFVLDRGKIDKLPTHIDYPFLDADRLFVRVVYGDEPVPEVVMPLIIPPPPMTATMVDKQTLVRQGVGAFLKLFDDIKPRDVAALQPSAQNLPPILVIGEDEFNQRIAEHEASRQRINHIRRLLGGSLSDKLEISSKMQEAMMYALANGGILRRYRGGFWAMENWREGKHPWFGTSTVKALVSRGLMSYTDWHAGRKGPFPVAAVVAEPSDEHQPPPA
jgi:hypothetical protein